jgi:hypothetical protein
MSLHNDEEHTLVDALLPAGAGTGAAAGAGMSPYAAKSIVVRPAPTQYIDVFKVVYVGKGRQDISSTVAILTLRVRPGIVWFYMNNDDHILARQKEVIHAEKIAAEASNRALSAYRAACGSRIWRWVRRWFKPTPENAESAARHHQLRENMLRTKSALAQAAIAVAAAKAQRATCSDKGVPVTIANLKSEYQYAINEGLVTCAKFVDTNYVTAAENAEMYKKGRSKLLSQFAIHSGVEYPYEVGCVARESNAGNAGQNGCIAGIHVHLTESAAYCYAQNMCVRWAGDPHACDAVNMFPSYVRVEDRAPEDIKWHRWNCRPNPWGTDPDVKCLGCMKPMNDSSRKYVAMDCGHGYLCATCATAARETMKCPECEINVSRFSTVW